MYFLSNILILKLLTIPVLTYVVSRIQRASPHWGGLVSSLPLTSGPVMVFLSIEHGMEFGRQAAASLLAGHLCMSTFIIPFFILAQRHVWWRCLLGALAFWATAIVCIAQISAPPFLASLFGLMAVTILFFYARQLPYRPVGSRPHLPHELLVRGAVSLIPLLLITGLASIIGPQYSGLLSAYPTMWSVVFAFTLSHGGRNAVAGFFRGAALGQYAFCSFFLVLIWLHIESMTLWFLIAIGISMAVMALCQKFQSVLMPTYNR